MIVLRHIAGEQREVLFEDLERRQRVSARVLKTYHKVILRNTSTTDHHTFSAPWKGTEIKDDLLH